MKPCFSCVCLKYFYKMRLVDREWKQGFQKARGFERFSEAILLVQATSGFSSTIRFPLLKIYGREIIGDAIKNMLPFSISNKSQKEVQIQMKKPQQEEMQIQMKKPEPFRPWLKLVTIRSSVCYFLYASNQWCICWHVHVRLHISNWEDSYLKPV